ncbi:MAG: hypothetical protein ACRDT8_02725, partial [Micromonosporaceae bacterium]
ELAAAGTLLLDPIREMLARQTLPSSAAMVDVVRAELGAGSAVRGALGAVIRSATPVDDRAQLA